MWENLSVLTGGVKQNLKIILEKFCVRLYYAQPYAQRLQALIHFILTVFVVEF